MAIQGAYGYRLSTVGKPLDLAELPKLEPGPDEVIVKVAGCGVCHTDVGFASEGVPTRHVLPLVLGHEIAGHVVDAGAKAQLWIGQAVIVPAVIACGECPACRAGRPTTCRKQFMPGNDGGARPSSDRMRSYSSEVRPCWRTSSGVRGGSPGRGRAVVTGPA